MRYLILVKTTKDSEAGAMPAEALIAEMAAYHEELARAGVLLDASGLKPTSKGFRIRFTDNQRSIVDGPFAEAKELIAGYTLIEVKSRDEAIAWAKRMPNPAGDGKPGEIEVRQLYELEDFAPSESIDRLRQVKVGPKG